MIFDQEIQEIHSLRRQYNKGNLSHDKFMANLKAFDQTHKIYSSKINAYAVAVKAQRGIKKLMEQDTLIGHGSIPLIENGAFEVEMIKCPDQGDKLITRAKCLDYSGSHETCRTCDHDKVTKSLLLGN